MDRRLYIKRLLKDNDLVLLQETWLFDWEQHKLCDDDSVRAIGVSGMDPQVPLVGRPHGGCAILFHAHLKIAVNPIITDSRRLVACTVLLDSSVKLLLCNVYTPCDSHLIQDLTTLRDTLSEIKSMIALHHDIDFVIIGGDFNADLLT